MAIALLCAATHLVFFLSNEWISHIIYRVMVALYFITPFFLNVKFEKGRHDLTFVKLSIFGVILWKKAVNPDNVGLDCHLNRSFEASHFWIPERINECVYETTEGKRTRLFPVIIRFLFDEKKAYERITK